MNITIGFANHPSAAEGFEHSALNILPVPPGGHTQIHPRKLERLEIDIRTHDASAGIATKQFGHWNDFQKRNVTQVIGHQFRKGLGCGLRNGCPFKAPWAAT